MLTAGDKGVDVQVGGRDYIVENFLFPVSWNLQYQIIRRLYGRRKINLYKVCTKLRQVSKLFGNNSL